MDMKSSRFTEEQIIGILREHEAGRRQPMCAARQKLVLFGVARWAPAVQYVKEDEDRKGETDRDVDVADPSALNIRSRVVEPERRDNEQHVRRRHHGSGHPVLAVQPSPPDVDGNQRP